MKEVPSVSDGAKVVCYAILDRNCHPTFKCEHLVGGQTASPAAALAICQYEKDQQYYLFHCNENWRVVADTLHESIQDAKQQGDFEYDGLTWLDRNENHDNA